MGGTFRLLVLLIQPARPRFAARSASGVSSQGEAWAAVAGGRDCA
jgi:hypothetical protein